MTGRENGNKKQSLHFHKVHYLDFYETLMCRVINFYQDFTSKRIESISLSFYFLTMGKKTSE